MNVQRFDAQSVPAPRTRRRPVSVFVPLILVVWLVLAPLAVIATPLVLVAAPFWRINPFSAVAAMFGLLIALGGVRVEVQTPDARVSLF